MRNIALYGGAFDPPHIGHFQLVNHLSNLPLVHEVWLLPCGDREDKKLFLSMASRFEILKLLFESKPQIKISDVEINMSKVEGKMIQTYDLLNRLKLKHDNVTFYFVLGGDNVVNLKTWGHAQQLIKNNNFIIFNRKGFELQKKELPPQSYLVENNDIPQISSTQIKAILNNQSIKYEQKIKSISQWVPQIVVKYLIEKKLI